ncbi:MAG TPA: hypothetical protein VG838_10365 [Opitutaceae bacterium]|nr:hypothetical protein [Opitutaceae bacterium]
MATGPQFEPQPPTARRHHGLAGLLAWILCSALYLWTANGVADRDADRDNVWHHYQYMVDGFLSGHLYLSREPAKELLALPDPYDPVRNLHYRFWDASLYHGKYYLYYGPLPAILLMLPWKLLAAADLPQRLATGLFACGGLGALALLLTEIRRRLFRGVTPAQLFLAIVLAGHVSWLPVILRRPAFWELPIVTAAALLWWSFYCLWRYHESGGRSRWAWAGGVIFSLTLAARPTYLFAAPLVVLLFTLPFSRERTWPQRLRLAWPVIVPLGCSGLALAAYNYGRFGHPLEFGQHYQLWGVAYGDAPFFSLRFLPFNLGLYFFSLPELSPYFPFLRTIWVGDLPAGFLGVEDMPGLLFTMPVLLAGFVALGGGWHRRRDPAMAVLVWLLTGAALASAIIGGVLFCFGGACSRYITEVLAGWSPVTAVGFLGVFASAAWSRIRLLRLLVRAGIAWSIAAIWLASYEFRSVAQTNESTFYHPAARLLNYPSYWAARNSGQIFGPVALDVRLPEGAAVGSTMLIGSGRAGTMNSLLIERPAPGQVQLKLVENDLILFETPVLAVDGPLLHVICHAPWLYPPVDHPYWSDYVDPGEREERQTMFAIEVNGVRYARFSQWFFDSTAFDPFVHRASAGPAIAWVDKISRVPSAPLPAWHPVRQENPSTGPATP